MIHATILPLLPALRALCRRYGVQQLYLFGSAVTEHFDSARSDVDALMSLPPMSPLAQGETLLSL